MTSKEALEKIKNIELYHREFDEDEDFDGDWKCLEYTEYDGIIAEVYHEEINAIEQDLKRLEELEQENKELKEFQVLTKQGLWNLKQENEKFKKAIEIEYNKFNFKFNDENLVIYLFIKELPIHIYTWCFDNKQEYDLLKEVLGNAT